MAERDTNGWSKYEVHVISKLDDHSEAIERIWKSVSKIDRRLDVLWFKMAGIATVATIVGAAIATAIARTLMG